MKPIVSLFDFTGDACRPWAEAGYICYCFDFKHPTDDRCAYPDNLMSSEAVGLGRIVYVHWNADKRDWLQVIKAIVGPRAYMVFGWPPCDDMAGCGAKHWAGKAATLGKDFQERAALRAKKVEQVAAALDTDRWMVENPSGALSRLWRKWDFTFHPHQYGGYLLKRDKHPKWPQFIAPRDAYKKLTCVWKGAAFVEPERKSVPPEILDTGKAQGSRQFTKLGGRSEKTKTIRSSGPRGFLRAVYLANREK